MVTHMQALQAFKTASEIGKKEMDAPVSLTLFHLKKSLQDAVDFVSQEESKLIESCSGTVTPEGTVKIEDKKKLAEFIKKQSELYKMEYEFSNKVNLSVSGLPKVKESDLEALDPFVDFVE